MQIQEWLPPRSAAPNTSGRKAHWSFKYVTVFVAMQIIGFWAVFTIMRSFPSIPGHKEFKYLGDLEICLLALLSLCAGAVEILLIGLIMSVCFKFCYMIDCLLKRGPPNARVEAIELVNTRGAYDDSLSVCGTFNLS